MSNRDSEESLLSQGLADVLAELVSNIGIARMHTAQEIEKLSKHFVELTQNINEMQALSKQYIHVTSDTITEDTQKSVTQLHNQLQNYNQDITQEVSNIMVALQFQDRINQILQQVEENLTDLSAQKGAVDWPQVLAQTAKTFQRFDGGWAKQENNNEENEPLLF